MRGSYRVRLTTNGGGPGNVQTLVYRARYSNTGVLLAYGLATPAYGERAGEDNAGGNTRGYAPQLDAFVDSYASFRLGLIANALVTDGSGVARISTSLIQNESNPLCVIRSASGDLQTNTASAVQVPLVELEAGDVMTADLFVTVRNSSGTIAGRWRVSALLHHQGGVAQIIGGVTPDADAKKTDVGLDATLIVSASTLYLQVSPLLTPLRWGWESRYQQQGFS